MVETCGVYTINTVFHVIQASLKQVTFLVFYISLASHTFKTDTIKGLLKIIPKNNKNYTAYQSFTGSKCSDFVGNVQLKSLVEIQIPYKIFSLKTSDH